MRPSNSGMATPDVTSYGLRPASESSHCWRDQPDDGAWTMGTPSSASARASHASPSSPPGRPFNPAPAATPPAARTVVMTAVDVVVAQGAGHGVGALAAQGVAPERQWTATARLDGVAEVVDEARVPGDEVRTVEHDADDGTLAGTGGPPGAEVGDHLAADRTRGPRAARCRRRTAGSWRCSPVRRAPGRRTPR